MNKWIVIAVSIALVFILYPGISAQSNDAIILQDIPENYVTVAAFDVP